MSPLKLEERDRYFTKLKTLVHSAFVTNGNRKVMPLLQFLFSFEKKKKKFTHRVVVFLLCVLP